jgi:elongation factor G
VEAAAEQDDDLLAKYLEGEELDESAVLLALEKGVKAGTIVPVLVGSSLPAKASTAVLDALIELVPPPSEARPETSNGTVVPVDAAGPLAALVFKTAADPFVGKLTYFKVVSGTLRADSHVWNATKGKDERLAGLSTARGKQQEPAPALEAGDIGVVAKLADTGTGDTLCAREHPIVLAGIEFAVPNYAVALHPKGKTDVDKMGPALARLCEEDHTVLLSRDPDTAETILRVLGEAHADISLERLKRKFGVELTTTLPRIPYKETITTNAVAEYKHKKQTGGHGQYGHVFLELSPRPRGEGFQFTERVVGGAVPRNFYPAVEKGVHEATREGALAHCPVVDVSVVLTDGSYHAVDSSEMAFKLAASHAFKKGVLAAHPVLLEPVQHVEIAVPERYMGDVLSDLNTKRARVHGMQTVGGVSLVDAHVPLSEMQRYALELRSIAHGRGSFTAGFSHFEEVPTHLAGGIIEASRKAAEAAA